MTLFRNLDTDKVVDLPDNVGNHPKLGARFEPYNPDSCDFEEDKVIVEGAPSTQRLAVVATPKPVDSATPARRPLSTKDNK